MSNIILEYNFRWGVFPNVVFTLQLQLFTSDLPLNQSEYTADTLSSNQNRVDHRKWNLMSSSHWPIYNKFPPGYM